MKINKYLIFLFFLIPLYGCISTNKSKQEKEFNVKKILLDSNTHATIILGGGVGGLTASIYLAQAGLNPLVIQGESPGGLITQSMNVENWPGEMTISGKDLVSKIKAQALKCGANIINQKVCSVDFSSWPYKIKICNVTDTTEEKEIKALTCIVVMGSKPNLLNIVGEMGPKGYFEKGVSTCAICDGALYKDKVVAVVGGGNAAMAECLYLSGLAKKVYVIVRSDKLRASHHEQELAHQKQNIEFLFNTKVAQILGNGSKLTSLILEDTKADVNATNAIRELSVDGLFLAIGATPNTQLFKNQLELDERGFIKKFDGQETSKPGIYTAGDISDDHFKQAITASGDAAKAALQSIEFLQKAGYSHIKKEIQKQTTENKPTITIVEIKNKKQFEATMTDAGNKLIVVDFYGTYCIPCKNMAPIFEKLAQNYKDNAIFVKVNASENIDIAQQFEIQSVPTFLFIKNENVIQKIEGSKSYKILENILKQQD